MKLSTKGRYGLRAIIDMAVNSEDGTETISIQSISQRQGISETYLEQLMRPLKQAGLINSIRGAGGGYQLARDAAQISVGEVLRALEGDLKPVDCGAIRQSGGCDAADSCVTKLVWKRMNEAIQNAVDSITLGELIDESRKMKDINCNDAKYKCEQKAGI